MTELHAWLIAVAAALMVLFAVFVLTRPLRGGFVKFWLRGTAAVVLLLPAPVPGFENAHAPAVLVAFFEILLQRDGQPAFAVGLLLAGIVAVTVAVGGYCYWRRQRRL